jgi:hypothetical protein
MRAQKEDTKSISFLGRKRINQKDDLFKAFLSNQESGQATCHINYNIDKIYKNVRLDDLEVETDLVVDIFVLGKIERYVLPKDKDQASFDVFEIPDGATPELRLKIVANDIENVGRIFAATAKKISFKSPPSSEGEETGESSQGFLKFEQSDQLDGRLVEVEWRQSQSDLFIRVDRSFYQKYRQSPLLPVTLYPDMLRSVVIHLLSRYDELNDLESSSMAYHWLRFIEDKLEVTLVGEDRLYDPDNPESLPDVTEQIVLKFMSKKFRSGKTFLEGLLNGN